MPTPSFLPSLTQEFGLQKSKAKRKALKIPEGCPIPRLGMAFRLYALALRVALRLALGWV